MNKIEFHSFKCLKCKGDFVTPDHAIFCDDCQPAYDQLDIPSQEVVRLIKRWELTLRMLYKANQIYPRPMHIQGQIETYLRCVGELKQALEIELNKVLPKAIESSEQAQADKGGINP